MLPIFTTPRADKAARPPSGSQSARRPVQSAPSSDAVPVLPALNSARAQTAQKVVAPVPPVPPRGAPPSRAAFEEKQELKRDALWSVREKAITMLLEQSKLASVAPTAPSDPAPLRSRPNASRGTSLTPHAPPLAADITVATQSRTKAIMRRIAQISSPEQLIVEETALRDLVATNETRLRNVVVMQRMRESLQRAERHSQADAESVARTEVLQDEDQQFELLCRQPLAILVEEYTARGIIERAALPATNDPMIARFARTTAAQLLWRDVTTRRHGTNDQESLERDEITARKVEEYLAILTMRRFYAQCRAKMEDEHHQLRAEQSDRYTLELAELAARDAFEAIAMERHRNLLSDLVADRRRLVARDVTSLERISRESNLSDEAMQWTKLQVAEAAQRTRTLFASACGRLERADRVERSYLQDAEAAEFHEISVNALRQWQMLWEALVMARGPRQEVEKMEAYHRFDIESEERRIHTDLVVQEAHERADRLRQTSWQQRLLDEHVDGRVALATMEAEQRQLIRALCEVELIRALRRASAQPLFDEIIRAELYSRGEIEFEAYRTAVLSYIHKEVLLCLCEEDADRARLQEERDVDLRMIELRHKNERNLSDLATDRGLAHRIRRLEGIETASRSAIEAAEDTVRSQMRNAAYDILFDARDAVVTALRDAKDAAGVTSAEDRRRQLLQHTSLQSLHEIHRLGFSAKESLVRAALRREEGQDRSALYMVLLENAEDISRWDIHWDEWETFLDIEEAHAINQEAAARCALQRTETDHRGIILAMRNGPLPVNIWLGSLEGDEEAIRQNIVFEAEVSANSNLQFIRLVFPEMLRPEVALESSKELFVYHDEAQMHDARQKYFLGEKSLAERVGEIIEAMVANEEPESRADIVLAELRDRDDFSTAQQEMIARRDVEEFEVRQRKMVADAMKRIIRNLRVHEATVNAQPLLEAERESRDRLWMENRAAVLALFEQRTLTAQRLSRRLEQYDLADTETVVRQEIDADEEDERRALLLRGLEGAVALAQAAQVVDERIKVRLALLGGVEVSSLPQSAEMPSIELAPLYDPTSRLTVQPPAREGDDGQAGLKEEPAAGWHTATTARSRDDIKLQQFAVSDAGQGYVTLRLRCDPSLYLAADGTKLVSSPADGGVFELAIPKQDPREAHTDITSPARAKPSISAAIQSFIHTVKANAVYLVPKQAPHSSVAVCGTGVETVKLHQQSEEAGLSLLVPASHAEHAARMDRDVSERRAAVDDAVAAAVHRHNSQALDDPSKIDINDSVALRLVPFEFVPRSDPTHRLTVQRRTEDGELRLVMRPKTMALSSAAAGEGLGKYHALDAGWSVMTQSFNIRAAPLGFVQVYVCNSGAVHGTANQMALGIRQGAKDIAIVKGSAPLRSQHWEVRTVAADSTDAPADDKSSREVRTGAQLFAEFGNSTFEIRPADIETAAVGLDAALAESYAEQFTLISAAQSDAAFVENAQRERRVAAQRRALAGLVPAERIEIVPITSAGKRFAVKDRFVVTDGDRFSVRLRDGTSAEQFYCKPIDDTGFVEFITASTSKRFAFDTASKALVLAPIVAQEPCPQTSRFLVSVSQRGGIVVSFGSADSADGPALQHDGTFAVDTAAIGKPEFRFVSHAAAAAAAAEEAATLRRTENSAALMLAPEQLVELVPKGEPRLRLTLKPSPNGGGQIVVEPRQTVRGEDLDSQRFHIFRRSNGAVRVECLRGSSLLSRPANVFSATFVPPAQAADGLDWEVVPVDATLQDKTFTLRPVDDPSATDLVVPYSATPSNDSADQSHRTPATSFVQFTVMSAEEADAIYRAEAESKQRHADAAALIALSPLELCMNPGTLGSDRLGVVPHDDAFRVATRPRNGQEALAVSLVGDGYVRLTFLSRDVGRDFVLAAPSKPGQVALTAAPCEPSDESAMWLVAPAPNRVAGEGRAIISLVPVTRIGAEVVGPTGALVADDTEAARRPVFVAVRKADADAAAAVEAARKERLRNCGIVLPEAGCVIELRPDYDAVMRLARPSAANVHATLQTQPRKSAVEEHFYLHAAADGYIEIVAVPVLATAPLMVLCVAGASTREGTAWRRKDELTALEETSPDHISVSYWSPIAHPLGKSAPSADAGATNVQFGLRPYRFENTATLLDNGTLGAVDAPLRATFSMRTKSACDAEAACAKRLGALRQIPADGKTLIEIGDADAASLRRLTVDDTELPATANSGDRLGHAREQFIFEPTTDGFVRLRHPNSGTYLTAPLESANLATFEELVVPKPSATAKEVALTGLPQQWEVVLEADSVITLRPRSLPNAALRLDGIVLDANSSPLRVTTKLASDHAAQQRDLKADRLNAIERFVHTKHPELAEIGLVEAPHADRLALAVKGDGSAAFVVVPRDTEGHVQAFGVHPCGDGSGYLQLLVPMADGSVQAVAHGGGETALAEGDVLSLRLVQPNDAAPTQQWSLLDARDEGFALAPRSRDDTRRVAVAYDGATVLPATTSNFNKGNAGVFAMVSQKKAAAKASADRARNKCVDGRENILAHLPHGSNVEVVLITGQEKVSPLDAHRLLAGPNGVVAAGDRDQKTFSPCWVLQTAHRGGATPDDGYITLDSPLGGRLTALDDGALVLQPAVAENASLAQQFAVIVTQTRPDGARWVRLLPASFVAQPHALEQAQWKVIVERGEVLPIAPTSETAALWVFADHETCVRDASEVASVAARKTDIALVMTGVTPPKGTTAIPIELFPADAATQRIESPSRIPGKGVGAIATADRSGSSSQRFKMIPDARGFLRLERDADGWALARSVDGAAVEFEEVPRSTDPRALWQVQLCPGQDAGGAFSFFAPGSAPHSGPQAFTNVRLISAAAADKAARREQRRKERDESRGALEAYLDTTLELMPLTKDPSERARLNWSTETGCTVGRRSPAATAVVQLAFMVPTQERLGIAADGSKIAFFQLSHVDSQRLLTCPGTNDADPRRPAFRAPLPPDSNEDSTDSDAESAHDGTAQQWFAQLTSEAGATPTFVLRPRSRPKVFLGLNGQLTSVGSPAAWMFVPKSEADAIESRSRVAATCLARDGATTSESIFRGLEWAVFRPTVNVTALCGTHVVESRETPGTVSVAPAPATLSGTWSVQLTLEGFARLIHDASNRVVYFDAASRSLKLRQARSAGAMQEDFIITPRDDAQPDAETGLPRCFVSPRQLPTMSFTSEGTVVENTAQLNVDEALAFFPSEVATKIIAELSARITRRATAEATIGSEANSEAVVLELEPRPRRRRWAPDGTGGRLRRNSADAGASVAAERALPDEAVSSLMRFHVTHDDDGYVSIALHRDGHPVSLLRASVELGVEFANADECRHDAKWGLLVPAAGPMDADGKPVYGKVEKGEVWLVATPNAASTPPAWYCLSCAGASQLSLVPIDDANREKCSFFFYNSAKLDSDAAAAKQKAAEEAARLQLIEDRKTQAKLAFPYPADTPLEFLLGPLSATLRFGASSASAGAHLVREPSHGGPRDAFLVKPSDMDDGTLTVTLASDPNIVLTASLQTDGSHRCSFEVANGTPEQRWIPESAAADATDASFEHVKMLPNPPHRVVLRSAIEGTPSIGTDGFLTTAGRSFAAVPSSYVERWAAIEKEKEVRAQQRAAAFPFAAGEAFEAAASSSDLDAPRLSCGANDEIDVLPRAAAFAGAAFVREDLPDGHFRVRRASAPESILTHKRGKPARFAPASDAEDPDFQIWGVVPNSDGPGWLIVPKAEPAQSLGSTATSKQPWHIVTVAEADKQVADEHLRQQQAQEEAARIAAAKRDEEHRAQRSSLEKSEDDARKSTATDEELARNDIEKASATERNKIAADLHSAKLAEAHRTDRANLESDESAARRSLADTEDADWKQLHDHEGKARGEANAAAAARIARESDAAASRRHDERVALEKQEHDARQNIIDAESAERNSAHETETASRAEVQKRDDAAREALHAAQRREHEKAEQEKRSEIERSELSERSEIANDEPIQRQRIIDELQRLAEEQRKAAELHQRKLMINNAFRFDEGTRFEIMTSREPESARFSIVNGVPTYGPRVDAAKGGAFTHRVEPDGYVLIMQGALVLTRDVATGELSMAKCAVDAPAPNQLWVPADGHHGFGIVPKDAPEVGLSYKANVAKHGESGFPDGWCIQTVDEVDHDREVAQRQAVIQHVIGDLTASTPFEFVPAATLGASATVRSLALSEMLRVTAVTSGKRANTVATSQRGASSQLQAFVFVDVGDGFLAIVLNSNRSLAFAADLDNKKVVLAPFDELDQTQHFEMDELEGHFTLIPALDPHSIIEAPLDEKVKTLRIIDIDEATNFCEFVLMSKAEADAAEQRGDRRIGLLKTLFGPNVVPSGGVSSTFELRPVERTKLRLTVAASNDASFVKRDGKAVGQTFKIIHAGRGYISIARSEQIDQLLTHQPGGKLVFAPRKLGPEGDAPIPEQQFEVALVEEQTFTLSPLAAPGVLLEAASTPRLLPEAEATALCELAVIDHATVQAELDQTQQKLQARKDAIAATAGDLEAMTVFEIIPRSNDVVRWRFDPNGPRVLIAPRERGLGDVQQFIFADADDGYVSIVPWADTSLALARSENNTLVAVATDVGSDTQAFEIRLTSDGHFRLLPKELAETHCVNANIDIDSTLSAVELSTAPHSEFRLTSASGSSTSGSRPTSSGSAGRGNREARVAAISKIIGDLDAMSPWEICPSEAMKLALIAPIKAGVPVGVAPRAGETSTQFVFTDVGDGYVSIVPWSEPNSALQVSDAHQLTIEPAADDPRQKFEVVALDDGRFSLAPSHLPTHFVEVQLDKAEKLLGLVKEDEATNFCELVLQQPAVIDLNRPRRRSKLDVMERTRLDALKKLFGDAMETPGASSVEIELVPSVSPDMRVTADPLQSFVAKRAKGAKNQIYCFNHTSRGYVTIALVPSGELCQVTAGDDIVFMGSSPKKAQLVDEACEFEVAIVENSTFTLAPKTKTGFLIEVNFDSHSDRPTLRLIPEDEATNFCEFNHIDHAVAATSADADKAKKEKKAAKKRQAAVEKVVGDIEAMVVFELVPKALDTTRVQTDGVRGGQIRVAKFAKDDDKQHIIFTDAGLGYVNIVLWSESNCVWTVSADGSRITHEEIEPDDAKQAFEIVPFEGNAFALTPKNHPGKFVECQLDAEPNSRFLHLVAEDDATNFSEFIIQEPVASTTPEPVVTKAKVDHELVARNKAIKTAFNDHSRVKLFAGIDTTCWICPGAANTHLLASSDANANSFVFLVRDDGNGYVSLTTASDNKVVEAAADGTVALSTKADSPHAKFEVILLDGVEGFCLLNPALNMLLEVHAEGPKPYKLLAVPEDALTTFCELRIVGA